MSAWTLTQIVLNLGFAVGIFLTMVRLARVQREDPRLTRGLQVLQGKISVLEDLSDRTEVQVKELSQLLDIKAKDVQQRIELAETQIAKIRRAMNDSLEVAKIFQDEIPHQEIIERKNTIKYVKAARMAHQGASALEIAKSLDLPLGEVEIIAKVNRDGLVFDEAQLPIWAREQEIEESVSAPVPQMPATEMPREIEAALNDRIFEELSRTQFGMKSLDVELNSLKATNGMNPQVPIEELSLEGLGRKFRSAVESVPVQSAMATPSAQPVTPEPVALPEPEPTVRGLAGGKLQGKIVRKVEFPRIDVKPVNTAVE